MAARKPPTEVNSIVTYNRCENNVWSALNIQVGNAYEVSLRAGKTSNVTVAAIVSEGGGKFRIKVEWLYSKQDALEYIANRDHQRSIRTDCPNVLYRSTHYGEVAKEAFGTSIALVHRDLAQGFYGTELNASALKDLRMHVFDRIIDFTVEPPRIRTIPLCQFNNVEAGVVFPQPSTLSSEQLRTKIGQAFYRMKASTGGHRCSSVIDADFSAFCDLVYSIPHVRTKATVRVASPSSEDLEVLCNSDYLTKTVEGQDVVCCTVIPSSVKLIYNLKTFRLGISFSYKRERLQAGGLWVGLDNQGLEDIVEGVVRVSVRGQVVTDQLEAGGLPIDSTVTLAHVRDLMDLYSVGELADLERLSFYQNSCKVSG